VPGVVVGHSAGISEREPGWTPGRCGKTVVRATIAATRIAVAVWRLVRGAEGFDRQITTDEYTIGGLTESPGLPRRLTVHVEFSRD
jgi:hypothetical protein